MAKAVSKRGRLGTFGGVFTPSILTILGLVLFLRMGFVVGAVGLAEAILIILLASAISVLTSISMAAIATNLEIRGGGVYYIISRTLGLPFGGAIGLVLFVAQAISVGFYCVGFAEGVGSVAGIDNPLLQQAIAALAVLAMVAIAWFGAEWATRFQYVVMALLVLALISFAFGAAESWSTGNVLDNFGPTLEWGGFWIAFAIFFPAVTGFTQGVNMSGDLANPSRSIPLGTALAVGLSIIIYLIVALLLAGALPRLALVTNYAAMKDVSAVAAAVDAGIIAATLSSALASLLGAPRILQSLATDRVFYFLQAFAAAGPDNNPRRGILLTAAIALGIVGLGSLNLIAIVVSMFFVVTYGLLNYATYFEASGKSPSFRPSLTWYRPWISLAGSLAAVGVMLAINLAAGLAAIAVVFGIYQYLKRGAIAARWSDGQRSYHLQRVREHLLQANARAEHARDWRPQVLAFSDHKERRPILLTFADWIEGQSGLTTVIRVIEGKGRHARRARDKAELELAKELADNKLKAFPLVVVGSSLDSVVPTAIQAAGIGPTRINTVLVNWPRQETTDTTSPEYRRYFRNLNVGFSLGCNLLILDSGEAEWEELAEIRSDERVIDVWWVENRTGRLMLVLAYLLTRNDAWRNATIRLIVSADAADADAERARVEKVLKDVRIPGEILIVAPTEDHCAQVVEVSKDSSIVFIALGFGRERFVDWLGNDIMAMMPELPLCVLTMAAEEVDLSADPDAGEESARARARDAFDDAAARRKATARSLDKSLAALEKAEGDTTERAGELRAEAAAEVAKFRAQLADDEQSLATARLVAENLGVSFDDEAADDAAGEQKQPTPAG